jgi:hypothetical protein
MKRSRFSDEQIAPPTVPPQQPVLGPLHLCAKGRCNAFLLCRWGEEEPSRLSRSSIFALGIRETVIWAHGCIYSIPIGSLSELLIAGMASH